MNGYRDRLVLVTGASGFIGKRLALALTEVGARVVGVSRHARPWQHVGVEWAQADLTEADSVHRLFASLEPDCVFHLASEVLGSRDMRHVLPTLGANLLTSVNLLLAATTWGCERLVLAGSMEEPSPDEFPAVPSSPYAAAKWSAGGYARMFHALYATPAVVARIFMVYGPGQRDEKKLVPYVATSLLRGEVPKVSAGTRPVDWVFVDDVVTGLMRLGIAPGLAGKQIDIGSGVSRTVRQVVEELADIVDPTIKVAFGTVADRPMETVRVAAIEETRALTGWEPSTHLRAGLLQTVDWYRRKSTGRDE